MSVQPKLDQQQVSQLQRLANESPALQAIRLLSQRGQLALLVRPSRVLPSEAALRTHPFPSLSPASVADWQYQPAKLGTIKPFWFL